MLRAEMRLAWKTRAGHRHQVEGLGNEDAVFVTEEHPLFDAVLMVADGMGGHPRPGEASGAAVRAAREFLLDTSRVEGAGDAARALAGAVQAGNQAVRALRNGTGTRPPGTTLSLAAVAGGVLHVSHVGDGSVFLLRGGQVRSLAGGEDRRAGNRPAQFLGQDEALEPEQRQVRLEEGDRLLLCTDGLTRYFGEVGVETLERVLGRRGVEVQAVASQLTAHSRPDDYDDDTTVALAEVLALRPAPENGTAPRKTDKAEMELGIRSTGRDRLDARTNGRAASPFRVWGAALAGAVVGALLLAGGYTLGRGSARVPAGGAAAREMPVREIVPPEELKHLPPGNIILIDQLGNRVFSLATRSGRPASEPLELQALQVGPSGRLNPAGHYRLDPARGQLMDGEGNVYPVEVDGGTLRVLRGGTLTVTTRPGTATVYVDGRKMGASGQKLHLPSGRHRVRAEAAGWASEQEVEILAGGAVTLILQRS